MLVKWALACCLCWWCVRFLTMQWLYEFYSQVWMVEEWWASRSRSLHESRRRKPRHHRTQLSARGLLSVQGQEQLWHGVVQCDFSPTGGWVNRSEQTQSLTNWFGLFTCFCCYMGKQAKPGGRLNIKMSSYRYRDPHVKDKTVSQLSYL